MGLQRANAQCEYTLNMFDSFGDGWNNGLLTVTSGSTVYTFTMDNFNDDGFDSTLTFIVTGNAPLTLSWSSGFFDNEVSFELLNTDGDLVYGVGGPATGLLFSGTGVCPFCLKPSGLFTENIYDTRAKLRWTPTSPSPALGWWVIYGPQGFVPGPGVGDTVYVTLPKVQLTGLQKKTWYDFYVVQDCGGGEESVLTGPVSFQTYWTNDVGIAGVATPVSGCDLGVETVKIFMKNYGSAPQSLVPFRFSVNGVDAGVPQPQDGFYTGVLGKDSSELIEFETMYDFSDPGEYLITVYTQMVGDEEISNDTFNYRIVNRLVLPYQQNFEVWEGGWFVDTNSINPSWEFGVPQKTIITSAASGQNAWVTNLNGFYNLSERSYLNSPCFDLTDATDDAVIEFALNTSMETFYDGAYLEMSTDGGMNWDKVGLVGEGINWYTTTSNFNALGDVWSGNTNGWVTARHRLPGTAGEAEVKLRFVFVAGPFFIAGDGMGVDDIKISIPFAKDLVGLNASSNGDANQCGLENDHVMLTLSNFGNSNQAFFPVAYSINGGTPVVENIGGNIISPDEIFTYVFTTAFDSRDGEFVIKAWTMLTGEQAPANDTATYTVSHLPKPVPLHENFESTLFPSDWATTGGFVSNGHNNTSFVFGINLYSSINTFTLTTPRHGIISDGDSLSFDYRITDWSLGTVGTILSNGTEIKVQITTDCGQSFQTVYTINSVTHTPAVGMKKIFVNLSQFAGQSIQIRFVGTWGTGDFWFDLDNINILSCPADMNLTAQTFPATPGFSNGKAIVTVGLGNPPYTYAWSTGATQTIPLITNLPAGTHTVTVTDALGCSDVLTINIGTTATGEIEGLSSLLLQPNPTTGLVMFVAEFDRPVDARLQVTNLLGQQIRETTMSRSTSISEAIDLTGFANGLYLLRLTVEGQTVTRKLVKSN